MAFNSQTIHVMPRNLQNEIVSKIHWWLSDSNLHHTVVSISFTLALWSLYVKTRSFVPVFFHSFACSLTHKPLIDWLNHVTSQFFHAISEEFNFLPSGWILMGLSEKSVPDQFRKVRSERQSVHEVRDVKISVQKAKRQLNSDILNGALIDLQFDHNFRRIHGAHRREELLGKVKVFGNLMEKMRTELWHISKIRSRSDFIRDDF